MKKPTRSGVGRINHAERLTGAFKHESNEFVNKRNIREGNNLPDS